MVQGFVSLLLFISGHLCTSTVRVCNTYGGFSRLLQWSFSGELKVVLQSKVVSVAGAESPRATYLFQDYEVGTSNKGLNGGRSEDTGACRQEEKAAPAVWQRS